MFAECTGHCWVLWCSDSNSILVLYLSNIYNGKISKIGTSYCVIVLKSKLRFLLRICVGKANSADPDQTEGAV